MAVGANVLEHQFPKPLRFFTEGMSRRSVLIPAWWQTASRASRMVSSLVLLWAARVACASVLLGTEDVSPRPPYMDFFSHMWRIMPTNNIIMNMTIRLGILTVATP